jgi:hypothetical protein
MWRTQYDDRALEGAEAKVFAEALSSLLDSAIAEELDYYDLGIESFDNLTFGQRIAIADDLTDEEAQAAVKELKKLCHSIIKPS